MQDCPRFIKDFNTRNFLCSSCIPDPFGSLERLNLPSETQVQLDFIKENNLKVHCLFGYSSLGKEQETIFLFWPKKEQQKKELRETILSFGFEKFNKNWFKKEIKKK